MIKLINGLYPHVVCDHCQEPIFNSGSVYYDPHTGETESHLHKGNCSEQYKHKSDYPWYPALDLDDYFLCLINNAGISKRPVPEPQSHNPNQLQGDNYESRNYYSIQ
jgi:hypothetical protein